MVTVPLLSAHVELVAVVVSAGTRVVETVVDCDAVHPFASVTVSE